MSYVGRFSKGRDVRPPYWLWGAPWRSMAYLFMPQQKAHPIQLDRKHDDHSLWRGGCLKPTRLKPCMTYDDPVVLPIHHNGVWAPDRSMIMRLRKDKRHWWAPAKARSCPRQGRIEPLHMLTSLGLKSSPSLSWNDRWPVAGEGMLANMRRLHKWLADSPGEIPTAAS